MYAGQAYVEACQLVARYHKVREQVLTQAYNVVEELKRKQCEAIAQGWSCYCGQVQPRSQAYCEQCGLTRNEQPKDTVKTYTIGAYRHQTCVVCNTLGCSVYVAKVAQYFCYLSHAREYCNDTED